MLFQLLPIVAAILILPFSGAQFPAPVSYPTVIKSPVDPKVTISYKTPNANTCTTAFEAQKQYTGYVQLPPYTIAPYQQNYSINTFFWFIEARESPETAPLTIWLNGGPGSSSMIGLFQESGPCEVVQTDEGYATQARTWGWDRSSNVLYIDQPAQVGFSYDILVNKSHNIFTDAYTTPASAASGQSPYTSLNGTFSSGNPLSTANTTNIAAAAAWHFLQGFLSAFPRYNPGTRPNSTTTYATGVNLFSESYGGEYGPAMADYFEAQNAKRTSGQLSRNSTLEIKLVSLGIINGLVDQLVQTPYYPRFANNNTYGIKAVDDVTMLNSLSDFEAPGGCKEAILACRSSIAKHDPQGEGDESATNQLCSSAQEKCQPIEDAYANSSRNYYDIRQVQPVSFPSPAYMEYLNYAEVQQSIGTQVNYTDSNDVVFKAFLETGDINRDGQVASLARLLGLGIRVALMYGDADYICNWFGGEAISFAVAAAAPGYTTAFPAAGYAEIVVNSTYVGGAVRQFGNLSFSRIYDSGHLVPAYQPETAFTVFTRIIQGSEIAMGHAADLSTFTTYGLLNSTHTNKTPDQEDTMCWLRDLLSSCTEDQITKLAAGKGKVLNGVYYEEEDSAPSSVLPPSRTASMGGKGATATSTAGLTGVYVATGTPTSTSAAAPSRPRGASWARPCGLLAALSWLMFV
ncbi:alpha/beta-hydrolase [Lophium mytilinum]|uniref:Alpha/beta-hydrolase n=1 Tax=Lophium mytilinum TaxID=390894 RepID=A0A6A6QR93_9PEZI|nr:alpha/beta-hydrolase [Lophium mytilinum]